MLRLSFRQIVLRLVEAGTAISGHVELLGMYTPLNSHFVVDVAIVVR